MKRIAAIVIAGALLSGCGVVKPWQRGTLMQRAMQASPAHAGAAFEQHVHTIREAMAGASTESGVSCGCN